MAEHEVWKPVPGYKAYEVSNHGRIKSKDHILSDGRSWKGRVLRPSIDTGGYPTVTLGHIGQHRVHCLIMLAFRGKRPFGKEVCHYDGDRENNNLSNLYYGTRKENIEDCRRHRRSWWLNAQNTKRRSRVVGKRDRR